MKIQYRQYQYGGDYILKEMELPEGSHIYEIAIMHVGYRVKDKEGNVYTPGYVIKASQEFEDSMKIGDAWYRFADGLYFDEESVTVEPIDNCIPPKDCFIVFEQDNMKACRNPMDYQMIDKEGNLVEIDWGILREYYKEIAGIAKIRRFTRRGIETCFVTLKSMTSDDLIEVSLFTFEYGQPWGQGFSTHRCNLFTTEEKYKQLYHDKLEEYYQLFKE